MLYLLCSKKNIANIATYLRYTQILFEKNANNIAFFSKGLNNQILKFTIMKVVENIKSIRLDKGIIQEVLADALDFDVANYSRIENGKQELRVSQLEIIAKTLRVEVIDLFTYPKIYVDKESIANADRISVTFEVSPDKRDILLNLVTKKQERTIENRYAAEKDVKYKRKE